MKDTSELLRNARKEKNLTLEEISSQTKIQLHILRSLEAGEISDFRSIVFIKGFLKQYAKALDLDQNEVLKMFELEHSGNKNSHVSSPVAKLDDNEIRNKTNVLWFRTSSKFLTAGGILVVFALVTAIYFFSIKLVSYSQESLVEPSATEQQSEQQLEDLQEAAETEVADTNNETASEPPKEAEPIAETAEKPKIKENLRSEESLSLPAAASVNAAKNTEPSSPTAKVGSKPKMVTVDAFENVQIKAAWSTGKTETVKLKNNGKHIFYYADKLKLDINNGGGVGITTHEKEVGVPGDLGQPVTIDFE